MGIVKRTTAPQASVQIPRSFRRGREGFERSFLKGQMVSYQRGRRGYSLSERERRTRRRDFLYRRGNSHFKRSLPSVRKGFAATNEKNARPPCLYNCIVCFFRGFSPSFFFFGIRLKIRFVKSQSKFYFAKEKQARKN